MIRQIQRYRIQDQGFRCGYINITGQADITLGGETNVIIGHVTVGIETSRTHMVLFQVIGGNQAQVFR